MVSFKDKGCLLKFETERHVERNIFAKVAHFSENTFISEILKEKFISSFWSKSKKKKKENSPAETLLALQILKI